MSKQGTRKTGLAFSGGGTRSAALCSGVMRRLLHKGVSIDYLSTVSGGGYTGASYMDWKFRNGNKDDPVWHKEYFEHMRLHSNLVCDCNNPCGGLVDALMIISIVSIVAFFIPWVIAFTSAIPTAYLIDYFFGDILREGFTCPPEETHNFTATQIAEHQNIRIALKNTSETIECVPEFGPHMYTIICVFAVEVILFLFCYFLENVIKNRSVKYFLKVLRGSSGFIFAMTFLPWLIEEYIVVTPMWINVAIIALSIFIWLGFPPLRDKASLALYVYLFAYVVKWRIFKTPVLGFEYTRLRFWIMLWVCGLLLWITPYVGFLQMEAVHNYMAWRLKKTFFSPESRGVSGTRRIDVLCRCCRRRVLEESINKPLTLADLVDVQPEYKCNVTVNQWRKYDGEGEKNYEVLTLSPTGIERIDRGPEETEFDSQWFIKPEDITLSSAMATSAAAVSYDLGKKDDQNKSFRDLQIILGLGLGKTFVTQPKYKEGVFAKVVPMLVQFILAVPILGVPFVRYFGVGEIWEKVGAITFVSIYAMLTVFAVLPTGSRHPCCLKILIRWCVINIFYVRIVRSMMGITNVGPMPPPVMLLSDGGHVENLGLLSLFKLRLPRIVSFNGASLGPGDTYASDLLRAIKQAREKLRCSFTGVSGRDIEEDIREQFVETPPGKQPRSYRFKVQYYERRGFVVKEVGEGEVMLLMPRHPNDGIREFEDSKWNDFDDDVTLDLDLDLDESAWGSGPALKASEVDRLTGCCFECCNWKPLQCICNPLMGGFPFHSTMHQMFTPSHFSAYHREGYRACLEAKAAEFLMETPETI